MGTPPPSIVLQFIASEQARLLGTLQPAVDRFWNEHRRHSVEAGTSSGRYGVSLRRRAAGLSVQWFEIRYLTVGKSKLRRPYHVTLPKGRFRYVAGDFPRAREWELAHIDQIEAVAEPVRRLTPILGNLQRTFKMYVGVAGLDLGNMAEAVESVENEAMAANDLANDPSLPPELRELLG